MRNEVPVHCIRTALSVTVWDCITNDFRLEKHRPFGESEQTVTGEDHASSTARDDRVWTHVEAAKSYLSSRLAQIRIAGMGHGQGEPGVTDCVSVFLSASNAS